MKAAQHTWAAFLFPYFLDWTLTSAIFTLGGVESDAYWWGQKRFFTFITSVNLWGLLGLKFGALGLVWLHGRFARPWAHKALLYLLSLNFIIVCCHNVGVICTLT